MRVCLISVPIMDDVAGELRPVAMDAERVAPPYGTYVLAACLRQAGHEVSVVDLMAAGACSVDGHEAQIRDAELIGVSATSMAWPAAVRAIASVRAMRADVPIVCGGVHATMFDEYLLRCFPVQYVVRGEGEVALLELVDALEERRALDDVRNLSRLAPDGTLRRTPAAPRLAPEELQELPIADYELLPAGVYRGLSIESSRGCSFDCCFCSTPYRKSWRPTSAERFVDRLEVVGQHIDKSRKGFCYVVDDEFAMNPRRLIEIAGELERRGLAPPLLYDARAKDLLYPGLVDVVEPFTSHFLVGAECGYPEGLERVGKGVTVEQLEQAAAMLARHGLASRVDYSFVIGFPWEGYEEVMRTVRFAGRLHSSYGVCVLLQWYYQIPGSRLWDEAQAQGLVHPAMYDDFGFFTRDLYLFRSANRLRPDEIERVSEAVRSMVEIARLGDIAHRGQAAPRKLIEYRHPEVMDLYFPRRLGEQRSALAGLREIQKPRASSGLPRRTLPASGTAIDGTSARRGRRIQEGVG